MCVHVRVCVCANLPLAMCLTSSGQAEQVLGKHLRFAAFLNVFYLKLRRSIRPGGQKQDAGRPPDLFITLLVCVLEQ